MWTSISVPINVSFKIGKVFNVTANQIRTGFFSFIFVDFKVILILIDWDTLKLKKNP